VTTQPAVPGLQAERTTLAWTRTSFGFLVNGVLLTLRDWHGAASLAGAIPAALAGAAATCSYVIALRRQHTLGLRPLPARVTPRVAVYVVGISTPVLIVVTAIAELI
jgi:Domain of unknown function (DUF202)